MTDAAPMTQRDVQTARLLVRGMDCGGCVTTVRRALTDLPGVHAAEVYLAGERAEVWFDPSRTSLERIREAVEGAGYSCPLSAANERGGRELENADQPGSDVSRKALTLMGLVFGAVLLAVVFGEWLGVFGALTERVPLWIGAALVLAFGWRIFRNVLRNAVKGRVVSHALMSTGALAALAIGEWPTAALVVFFMRVGDYAESFTTERARRSLRDLTTMAPTTARVERDGDVQEVSIDQVREGDVVAVRPGDRVPVDGTVVSGHATVDQAAITGESMPVEAEEGTRVFAASIARLGSLRVRAEGVGRDTTFGRVIHQVERAEANRGETQRLADRFSAWYLPLVAAIAVVTYLVGGDLLAAVAVTVVACSCAFALATPVAMLASIGAAAKRGLLIKGGKYIEALAKADVLLLDKTGTLTRGEPELTDIVTFGSWREDDVLALAAAAERDSEHPLAGAVRRAASRRALDVPTAEAFDAVPGRGVRARIGERDISVGSHRMLSGERRPAETQALEADGKTVLYVVVDGTTAGALAAADALRADVPAALASLRKLGLHEIELLTGDNEPAAAAVAERLGIAYRANLLPEDKIARVAEHQARGRTVIMVGDGVNDAPALVQADVGIAMGAAGTDVAIEAAHVALMRDDWSAVPDLLRIARRTMRVVRLNLGFTAVYNVVGIALAAAGLLPPIFAAALQSIPDLGIMGNSARLLQGDTANARGRPASRELALGAEGPA